MLYLKRRKNESWGAMLMQSIYVYLLWGWRQRELSNIPVKCLEDLRIKLKPAEVSCKSCCASLGAHVMYCVWVTVKYSSWETQQHWVLLTSLGLGRSLTCSQRLLLCHWKITPGSLPGQGCCCASQAVPAAPLEWVPAPWVGAGRAWHVSASPAPPQKLQSQGDIMSGSAAGAGAFLSELHRDTGMPGFGYFHLWHVLTLIQLAST